MARNAYLPSIQASANHSWIGLGYSMDRDFTNSLDEQLPSFGNNIAIQASQVVFAGGKIRNGVHAAELGSQLAEVQARTSRNEVRYLIAATSLEITKLHNQITTIQSNIDLTQRVLSQMQTRYAEGTVLKSDISRYELLLKNLEFAKTKLESAIDIMTSKLSMAIGLPQDVRVSPLMDLSLPDQNSGFSADNAPAIRAAGLAKDLSETQLKITRGERLPNVALFAGDTFNGPDVTTFISGKMAGYGLLNKNFNFATVGVGISYDLDNLYKSSKKIRQSEAALYKSRAELDAAREGINLALSAAQTEYRDAFTRLSIASQALSLAEVSYQQVSDRYSEGLATITDLLDASSDKLESEMAAINAKIDILASYYKLQYICATL